MNHESRTSMEHLYAVGETACNGVHGRNRLASNSLLESLVFAKRAAKDLAEGYEVLQESVFNDIVSQIDLESYQDSKQLEEEYRNLVWDEIKRQ